MRMETQNVCSYVLGGYQLDWVLISSANFEAPDVNMEENLSGNEGNLLGAVVNPCHRNSTLFDPANWVCFLLPSILKAKGNFNF